MEAESVIRRRIIVRQDAFVDLTIWRLPQPVPPCTHGYKYRLAYVVDGVCVLRYDNEAGKGDHRHWGPVESPYIFVDTDRLLADFRQDVRRWNDENLDS